MKNSLGNELIEVRGQKYTLKKELLDLLSKEFNINTTAEIRAWLIGQIKFERKSKRLYNDMLKFKEQKDDVRRN